MTEKEVSLRLAFATDSGEHRVAGRLRDEHGEEHSFSTWVGLLSLLEAAHERIRAAEHAAI